MICALALLLLLDVSGSFEEPDFLLAREAHASAFESPEIHQIIERVGGISVRMVQFAEATIPITDWVVINTVAESNYYAMQIRGFPRTQYGGTYTGSAIMQSVRMFETSPCGDEQVIDIVTDGEGAGMPAGRDYAITMNVKINAIGMVTRYGDPTDWLRDNVITPGGFIGTTDSAGLERALRRKMVTEMAGTYD